MNLKSALVRNASWLLIGQGLQLIIQALYFVEIAKSLGTSNYGAFIAVAALVGMVSPFGDLGSGNMLIKRVARDRSLFPSSWGRALFTTGTSGSLLVAVVLLVSHFALPSIIPLRLVFLVSVSDIVCLNAIYNCAQSFQAFDQLNWTATITATISASRLAGATLLIAMRPHPTPLQWGYVYSCSTVAVAAMAIVLAWSKLGAPKMNWKSSAKENRDGLYFAIGLSAQTIYNDIDKTMLARLATLEATGIYGAAYRLIAVSFVPVSSVLTASYANFFRAGSNGVASCLRYARPLLLRALGYSVLVFAVLMLSANLVPHILGGEYARTTEALRWLALLPMFKAASYFFSNVLTGAGYQGLRACVQVGVGVFNVLVNLWIIPLYSWRGAAWSSLASDALLAFGAGAAIFMVARREKSALVRVSADAMA